jgi:hypothetical protein
MYEKGWQVHAEPETSFLANLNQNIGIVHRVCHTYFPRDAVEREDVFQDIMYQRWKSYPQFKWESKFSRWMYKVALNTVITHMRRRPWPMIESRSQAGHGRRMTSQFAAQSVSSLCGGTESRINRIVAHRGSAPPALTRKDRSRKRSSFLLKQKIPTGEEYSFSATAV